MHGTGPIGIGSGGFLGGGQLGYNWQFQHFLVVGIEADIQGSTASYSNNVRGSLSGVPQFPDETFGGVLAASRGTDYIGTVRGRLGWLVTPSVLVFGTGGLAYGGVKASTSISQVDQLTYSVAIAGAANYSDTRTSWTAGGGVEWLFWPNWSVKAEYLYYDLGSVSYQVTPLVARNSLQENVFNSFPQSSTRFNGNIVRAGLNYHFNWSLPALGVVQ